MEEWAWAVMPWNNSVNTFWRQANSARRHADACCAVYTCAGGTGDDQTAFAYASPRAAAPPN